MPCALPPLNLATASLILSREGRLSSKGGSASVPCNHQLEAAYLGDPPFTTKYSSIHVRHDAAIRSSDSAQLGRRLRTEFLQGSVGRTKVIRKLSLKSFTLPGANNFAVSHHAFFPKFFLYIGPQICDWFVHYIIPLNNVLSQQGKRLQTPLRPLISFKRIWPPNSMS